MNPTQSAAARFNMHASWNKEYKCETPESADRFASHLSLIPGFTLCGSQLRNTRGNDACEKHQNPPQLPAVTGGGNDWCSFSLSVISSMEQLEHCNTVLKPVLIQESQARAVCGYWQHKINYKGQTNSYILLILKAEFYI